jgi:hypothetical protein
MPYRRDTYDAMASLALTSDASNEPPLCSHAYPIQRPLQSGVERRP